MKEIGIFKGSYFYEKFLESFYKPSKKLNLDLNGNKITKALFFHLFKAMHSEWKMRIKFERKVKHALSGYFQDLIVFYLNIALGEEFETILEFTKDKVRPDILIKYKEKYVFAIEVKTNIGWDRQGPQSHFKARIKSISENFKIPKESVVYVFMSPLNVNKKFASIYWDYEKSKPKEHPKEFPYSNIYPLFHIGPDPYYWKYEKDFDKNNQIKNFKKNEILKRTEGNIIYKFESVITKIKKAAKNDIPKSTY